MTARERFVGALVDLIRDGDAEGIALQWIEAADGMPDSDVLTLAVEALDLRDRYLDPDYHDGTTLAPGTRQEWNAARAEEWQAEAQQAIARLAADRTVAA